MNNCVGPAYSRTKIYALRMTRGSSVYRNICAVRNGPQQQTRRPPLLLSIDGTDRQTDTRSLTAYYADRVIISLAVPSGVTSHWQPRQCRGPGAENGKGGPKLPELCIKTVIRLCTGISQNHHPCLFTFSRLAI